MSMTREQQNKLDDALLETLLEQVYFDDNTAMEVSIQAVLGKIGERSILTAKRRIVYALIPIALAATVFLAFTLFTSESTPSNQAYAAVVRSLTSAPSTREYRVTIEHQRSPTQVHQVEATLYLNDEEEFVLRHPGVRRMGEVLIGGDSKDRWLVPRRGPAYIGGQNIVGGWLSRQELPNISLHLSEMLDQLEAFYELELLPEQSIPDAADPALMIDCQHVEGKLKRRRRAFPNTIELWADIESGIARKIDIQWNRLPNERGPRRWTVELVGTPDLPSDWFTVGGHITPGRRLVIANDPDDLREIEIE